MKMKLIKYIKQVLPVKYNQNCNNILNFQVKKLIKISNLINSIEIQEIKINNHYQNKAYKKLNEENVKLNIKIFYCDIYFFDLFFKKL